MNNEPANNKSLPLSGRGAELGEAPVGRLLIKLSFPAMMAMVFMGLYNLVDTVFIGRGVGTTAMGGLSIALPLQAIIAAFGLTVGQGAASVVSRNLGAGNKDKAQNAAGNAFFLAFFFGLAVLVGGEFFMEPLLDLAGATDELRPSAREYLRIIFLGAPFLCMAMSCNNLLRAEGKAREAMAIMMVGTAVNILLDPIFIFLLKLGVAGAAWATVFGQFCNFAYGAYFFFTPRASLRIGFNDLKPRSGLVGEILSLGTATFIRQSGQSVVGLILNNMLGFYGGDIFISSYGIVSRLLMFLLMPLFGIVQGYQPIAGFNYGARQFGRVKQTLRLTIIFSTVYLVILYFCLMTFPQVFAGIFTADPLLIEKTTQVIRIVFLALPVIGLQITGGTYFLVVGKPFPSLVLNLSRQFLFLIPLLFLLSHFFGLTGLLSAFPIADSLAALVTIFWMLKELKTLKS
jgi:putative MATE family efflux protein